MKKLADYGTDDHPADDPERVQVTWIAAVRDARCFARFAIVEHGDDPRDLHALGIIRGVVVGSIVGELLHGSESITGPVQRASGLEPDAEVRILREGLHHTSTRLDTDLDQPAQRLPARPRVGVTQRPLQEWSQPGPAGVDHRVDRRAPDPAARVAEETAPSSLANVGLGVD